MRDPRSSLRCLAASGLLLSVVLALFCPVPASAQAPLRKIGELELAVRGLSASVEPAHPVVPRNVASAVRVVVRAGALELSDDEASEFFGADFEVQGELSGPGLTTTLSLPDGGEPESDDPFLLHFPPLPTAGDYRLANLRIVAGGRTVLDVAPSQVTINVIDRVLVTSVKTRPLTLDEIVARGVDLSDAENYLGFGFTLGLKLESEAVQISFPVIFNREGEVIPEPLQPPPAPPRVTGSVRLPRMPSIVPLLLEAEAEGGPGGPPLTLELPSGEPVRIPGLLVIPGDVGYLKQFFSAQLVVANGAPAGSGLVVRHVEGTIALPPGEDLVVGPGPGGGESDDPLSLPDLVRDGETEPHPPTLPVRGVGVDGEIGTDDDVEAFAPGEQGIADFTIRGEAEGFHPVSFDIRADLDGLPVGRVKLKGRASGGVLVRNPSFDMAFTVPSVVRIDEDFSLFVTVTNVGQGAAQNLTVTLPAGKVSGATLHPPAVQAVDAIEPGDSQTFEYRFTSTRTGQVVASYLRFDATDAQAVSGSLDFSLAVTDRGVPLSPDTLVLPSAVDAVPAAVTRAAMRVLGQAWSVANSPSLPAGVLRTDRSAVQKKALALAEAGLRTSLGQDPLDAVRDLAWDFHAGDPSPDPGFDQLLRTTEAGRGLAVALGAALGEPALGAAGGPLGYERDWAQLLASGPDFITFVVANGGANPAVDVVLKDDSGRRTASVVPPPAIPAAAVPGAVLLPLGGSEPAPILGVITAPTSSSYVLELVPREPGPVDVAVTLPRGDGTVFRATASVSLQAGDLAQLALNLARPTSLALEYGMDTEGVFHSRVDLAEDPEVRQPEGPRLIAATVIGPETLAGASPFGVSTAFLFDRVVDAASAADPARYSIPENEVRAARRQLSGRLVFASLAQPEGPHVPTTASVEGLADERGAIRAGVASLDLGSRLAEPGAIVTGRVITAEGEPVPGSVITYVNRTGFVGVPCLGAMDTGLSRQVLEDGHFELRYVRQSPCGPFKVVTQDPATGARREVTGRVRTDGERIVLDIALLARGTVTGTVSRFDSSSGSLETVPAAAVPVVAYSVTDTQSGGSAVTDGDGRYVIDGITVGAVNVRAGGVYGVGTGAGRIERPGTPAVVDILLDGNAARIHGTVRKSQGVEMVPVPAIQVLYYLNGSQLLDAVYTNEAGEYAFEDVPAGAFKVAAALNTRDRDSREGSVTAGEDATVELVIRVPDPETLGTVTGRVVQPDGTGVPAAIVNIGSFGAVTVSENDPRYPARPVGFFEIPDVPFTPYELERVRATSADGRQSGTREFSFPEGSTLVDVGAVVLSGLGEARFFVEDHEGQRLANQLVWLQGGCRNPCGCASASTGPGGEAAVFSSLPVGTRAAKAFRSDHGTMDVATGSATIKGDGQIGLGTLVYPGTGTVTVEAQEPGGAILAVHGAAVTLKSNSYVNDGFLQCGLHESPSRAGATDVDGRITFSGVNAGPVTVSVRHPFFDKVAGGRGTLKGGGELAFTVEFTDNLAGELSGTVYLPDGETPVGPGAQVTVRGPLPDVTVSTDPAGHFVFATILPPGNWTLTAVDSETGYVAQSTIALRTGQDLVHDVRLKGRGTVHVRVVDGADVPVEQATVRLSETEYPYNTHDGILDPSNEGVVTFRGVFEGTLSVEASDAFGRGNRVPGTLPGPGESVDLTVALTTTGTVAGLFHMPPTDGVPIPFGIIKLKSNGKLIGQATGGGDGRFSFDYVPAGQVRIDALDPLTGRTGFATGSLEEEGQLLSLDVQAQALRTVTGTVTANLLPEPRPEITIQSGNYQVETSGDENGVYRVDGVPAGRVVVTAARAGGLLKGTATVTFTEEGEPLVLNVALRDTGSIEGIVLEAGGAAPAPVSQVTVTVGGSGGGRQEVYTDEATGGFGFAAVPSGTAVLDVATVDGLDRATATVDVPALGVLQDVRIELNGIGSIRGQTVGVPEGFSQRVTLKNEGGFYWHEVLVPGDDDDRFAVSKVLAGGFSAHLVATRDGQHLYGTYLGEVTPGEETDFLLELQPTGSVEGTAFRHDGTPAHGAWVEVKASRVTLPERQVRDDGSFGLDGVPAGPVTVTVRDPFSGGVGRGSGDVPEDGVLVLDRIDLDEDPVAVESVHPPEGATGVALEQAISLVFSDPVANASSSTISVKDGATRRSLAPEVASDGLSVTLRPSGGLWPDGRQLAVHVTTALRDVYGRNPVQDFVSYFETVDLSPPYVVAVVPADGAIEVGEGATVTVTFDEPLAAGFDPTGLVVLAPSGGTPLAGVATLSLDRREASFAPVGPLFLNTLYGITVNGAEDQSGNRQTAPFVSSFVTVDTVPPVLTATAPAPGSWLAQPRPQIRIDVVDPGAGSGLDRSSATMSLDGGAVAPSASGTRMTFTPETDLAEGPHVVAATIGDRAGNVGGLSTPLTFGVDVTVPEPVAVTSPMEGQTLRGAVTLAAVATDVVSGIAEIRVFLDGSASPFATLAPPDFAAAWDTTAVADGWRSLTARALDLAGNLGPAGDAVGVLVDNDELTVQILEPAPGTPFRDTVTARAQTSEPAARVDFSAGGPVVAGAPLADRTYEATLDLSSAPEGEVELAVTAFGLLGEETAAAINIVADRTPPGRPDVAAIVAEESDPGYALVQGQPGAVEGSVWVAGTLFPVTVEVTNLDSLATATGTAAGDGSFAVQVAALLDTQLSVVATDAAGNRSEPSTVVVRKGSHEDGVPLEGLSLWVSADQGVTTDALGRVEHWADRSDEENDLRQALEDARPELVPDGFNGWPILRFDGADDSVTFTRRLSSTVRTVFWVVRESPDAGFGERSLLGDTYDTHFRGAAGDPGAIWAESAADFVKQGQTWVNGRMVSPVENQTNEESRPREMSVVSWLSSGAGGLAQYFGRGKTVIGWATDADTFWHGDLAELIIYDRVLDPEERASVEDHLVRKYRPYVPSVATPSITPAGGTFSGSTLVQLRTSTPDAEIRYTRDGTEPTRTSEAYTESILLNTTTTLKARAYREGFGDSATATATFVEIDESPIVAEGPAPRLWLRADAGIATDGGGWVTEWRDMSGHGNDATQREGSRVPRLVPDAVNGLPVVRFDGEDDSITFTGRLSGTVRTVFWVVRESPGAGFGERGLLGDEYQSHFRGGEGDPGAIWSGAAADFVRQGQTWVNGLPVSAVGGVPGEPDPPNVTKRPREMSVVSWVTNGTGGTAKYFGRGKTVTGWSTDADTFWHGDLAELIVYDRVLSAWERQAVEDYLLARYRTVARVTTPVIDPPGGVISSPQTVRISTRTPGAEIRYTLDGAEPTLDSPFYEEALTIESTTTLKAKAFLSGLEDSTTATAGFLLAAEAVPAFPALADAGPGLWWRADVGVPHGAVGLWSDLSGHDNDGFQKDGSRIPLLVPDAVNGLPVVRFDGEDDSITFTGHLNGTVRTVFWVVRESPGAGFGERGLLGDEYRSHFRGGEGDPGAIWSGAAADFVRQGQTWVNGLPVSAVGGVPGEPDPPNVAKRPREMSVVSWVTNGTGGTAKYFGRGKTVTGWSTDADTFWNGDLAELIIYDRALTKDEVRAVEDYLNARYQLFIRVP